MVNTQLRLDPDPPLYKDGHGRCSAGAIELLAGSIHGSRASAVDVYSRVMPFDIAVCQYRNPLTSDAPFLIEFEAPSYMASPRLKSSQILTLSCVLLIQLCMYVICLNPSSKRGSSCHSPSQRSSSVNTQIVSPFFPFPTIISNYHFRVETPFVPSLLRNSHLYRTQSSKPLKISSLSSVSSRTMN